MSGELCYCKNCKEARRQHVLWKNKIQLMITMVENLKKKVKKRIEDASPEDS